MCIRRGDLELTQAPGGLPHPWCRFGEGFWTLVLKAAEPQVLGDLWKSVGAGGRPVLAAPWGGRAAVPRAACPTALPCVYSTRGRASSCPLPSRPLAVPPEAQRQAMMLPARHFGPGTAYSAKSFPAPHCLQTWHCHRSQQAAGMGATRKGHQAGNRALSLGQAEAAGVQPLPRHRRCEGEQSLQTLLLHVAVISVRKLPPSIINHAWLPARGTALAQLPCPGVGAELPSSMRGWSGGPCPAQVCTPRAIPEMWDGLAASRHP